MIYILFKEDGRHSLGIRDVVYPGRGAEVEHNVVQAYRGVTRGNDS